MPFDLLHYTSRRCAEANLGGLPYCVETGASETFSRPDELVEHRLLGAAAFVEQRDGADGLLVTTALNSKPCSRGSNRSSWEGLPAPRRNAPADDDHAAAAVPAGGLPAALDRRLEVGEAGERDGHRVFDAAPLQVLEQPAVEERRAHPRLRRAPGSAARSRSTCRLPMESRAPVESATLPDRCSTSSAWPVCATVANSGQCSARPSAGL